jgi:hypothetical protein
MLGQGSVEDRAGAVSRYRADVQARRSIDVDRSSVDRVAHQAVRGLTTGWIAALRIDTVVLGLFIAGCTLLACLGARL